MSHREDEKVKDKKKLVVSYRFQKQNLACARDLLIR